MIKLFLIYLGTLHAIIPIPHGFVTASFVQFPPTQISDTNPNITTASKNPAVFVSIPTMTSNTTPAPYVVSASSEYNTTSYASWHAFNKSIVTNDWWISGNNTFSGWIKIKVPAGIAVNYYQIQHNQETNPNSIGSWTFEGSNDDSTWTVLDTRANITWTRPSTQTFSFTNFNTYTYYILRISVANNDGTGTGGEFFGFNELNLLNNNPVVSSYMAFDNSDATAWYFNPPFTAGEWIKLELATPSNVIKYRIKSQQSVNPLSGCPSSFILQGSTDNSLWTDLDTRTGITWTGAVQEQEFVLPSISIPYKYFRLVINATSNNQPPNIINIAFYKRN